MLSLVVTVRQINPFIVGGYIKKRDLMVIFLKNPRLPEQYIPQVCYIQGKAFFQQQHLVIYISHYF